MHSQPNNLLHACLFKGSPGQERCLAADEAQVCPSLAHEARAEVGEHTASQEGKSQLLKVLVLLWPHPPWTNPGQGTWSCAVLLQSVG